MPAPRLLLSLTAFSCIALATTGFSLGQGAPEPGTSALTLSLEARSTLAVAAIRDPRVRDLIGSQTPEVASAEVFGEKTQAERVLSGHPEGPPKRQALLLLYNRQTNRAARVLIDVASSRVIEVVPVAAAAVPLSREDIVEAFAIAKGNADVREFLGGSIERFRVSESPGTSPYAVQGLHVRSSNRQDPCYAERCVDLLFFTERGYLPGRVLVDLTKRTVKLEAVRR